MKTKNTVKFGIALAFVGFALVGCNKNKCAECHYDDTSNGSVVEVEMGEYCGDDLEEVEANGYSDGTNTYVVHCGEH